jgi:DHA2 family multidrug resistance protein
MAQTMEQRREQLHLSRLGDTLSQLNPQTQAFLSRATAFFYQRTGDPVRARQMALRRLADLREQQGASLSYFDVFFLCAIMGVFLAFLVLFMKRSVAEKGAHVAAE